MVALFFSFFGGSNIYFADCSFEQTENIISKEAFKINVKKNLLESIDIICKRLFVLSAILVFNTTFLFINCLFCVFST